MPSGNWSRTDNFIKTSASRSYIGAKGIFNAIDTKLLGGIADPEILGFYNTFNPLNTDYNSKYAIWDGFRSTGIGKTLGVVQLIDLLSSTKIKGWDIAIQIVYDNKTPEYAHLLPHHRAPFQAGSVGKRESALINLVAAIGTDVSLATVKTSVSAFLTSLQTAMTAQSTQITSIDTAIVNLEASSNTASDAAFGIFGGFLAKFSVTPKLTDAYFPVNLLNSIAQLTFTAKLKTLLPRKLFKRKLDIIKNFIKGLNVGTDTVIGYFTDGITNKLAVGAPFISMPPNSSADYDLVAAGYTDKKRHFYIANTGAIEANVEIDIMVIN